MLNFCLFINLDVFPFAVTDMPRYEEIDLMLSGESFVHGVLYLPQAVVTARAGNEYGGVRIREILGK